MSFVVGTDSGVGERNIRGRRARMFALLWAAGWAEFVATVLLSFVGLGLGALNLVGLRGEDVSSVFWPWPVVDPWSLAAAGAWAVLVASAVGLVVRASVFYVVRSLPSRGWTIVSVGVGGYGGLLVGSGDDGKVFLSVVGGAVILRLTAFNSRGDPRSFPVNPSRGLIGVVVGVCVGVVASFSLLHPFASTAMEIGAHNVAAYPDSRSLAFSVRPGQAVTPETKLQAARFQITVTGVSVISRGDTVRAGAVSGALEPLAMPNESMTRLPITVPAGRSLWVRYPLAIIRCEHGTATVNRLRISYRELGVSLSQVITTETPVTLKCT